MVPVFSLLYVLTIPDGTWPAVMYGQLIATALILAGCAGYFGAAIWVTADSIAERGFFGRMRRMSRHRIASILLVNTFDGDTIETLPQLFVRDHLGRQQFRMRGQFWSKESMDALIDALGVPVVEIEESVSTSELRNDYPGLLYWFERHPILASALFAAIVAIIATTLILLFEGNAIPLA